MAAHTPRSSPLVALVAAALLLPPAASAQAQPDWARVEEETLRHYQALLRLDTRNPPGNETRAVDYLEPLLRAEGIEVERVALEPARANLIARIRGNGSKRPLLLMAHTDIVTIDSTKWTFPAFSATRDGGYVYGRGAVDDKDNLAGSLMMMLLLKRLNVPLDRDVIFLAESAEEGGTRVGIQYVATEHFAKIDAEYCLAEGGGLTRQGGQVKWANVGVLEKRPSGVELIARGTAGHASIPLQDNAFARLGKAVVAVAAWDPPVKLNEVTREYFRRLATISPPEDARRFNDVISGDPARVQAAVDYFERVTPVYAAIVRTTASPTMITGGIRTNVIPSEVRANIDVRILPDETADEVVERIRAVVDDPQVEVRGGGGGTPPGPTSIGTDAFRAIEAAVTEHYGVITLPSMGTGATDSRFLRPLGMQCYGIGPATDQEDGPKGFGAHSDQERLLESELHRFVRFYWDIVNQIAGPTGSN